MGDAVARVATGRRAVGAGRTVGAGRAVRVRAAARVRPAGVRGAARVRHAARPEAEAVLGGFVVLGILACGGILFLPVSIVAGIVGAVGSGNGAVVLAAVGLSLLAPLVLGAFLVGRGSPQRRGFGLGLFIGWGLFVVVGAGSCVAILVALSRAG